MEVKITHLTDVIDSKEKLDNGLNAIAKLLCIDRSDI